MKFECKIPWSPMPNIPLEEAAWIWWAFHGHTFIGEGI